jgi:hypothetical protein
MFLEFLFFPNRFDQTSSGQRGVSGAAVEAWLMVWLVALNVTNGFWPPARSSAQRAVTLSD